MNKLPACPVCHCADNTALESYYDPVGSAHYMLFTCGQCALVFSRPMEFPGGAWYERFNYTCGYEDTACVASKTRFPYFLDRLPSPREGRIIDIGCASGRFLQMAAERGYAVEGLDVDSRFVAMAHAAGLSGVSHGVLDEEFARRHREVYDAVAIMEVLEHVADPIAFLQLCRDILKPKGLLFISVPDNRRPTPFGRDIWDYPPHHLTRWSPTPLRLALERAGFFCKEVGAIPIGTSEYSRIWADRSAQGILRGIKRMLFGAGVGAKPMDDLLASAPSPIGLPDKMARVRLVSLYHTVFMTLTFPFFAFMLLYYRLTWPESGLSILAIAQKSDERQ